MEENHYYPFGLKHDVYASPKQKYELVDNMENTARPTYVLKTDYQYKYNGKEFQDELGLNLYDYGARNYDAALGRWMNIDPLAYATKAISPYAAMVNNPVFFMDPDGMKVINGHQKTKEMQERKVNRLTTELGGIDKESNKKEWNAKNKELNKASRDLKATTEKYETAELMIAVFKELDPEWYDKADNLKDLDGNTIDVAVESLGSNSSFNHGDGKTYDLEGATGAYPLGFPENPSKTQFMDNRARQGRVTIGIDKHTNERTFWHELGHMFWLTSIHAPGESNAFYYYGEYLENNPHLKRAGGHGEGDVQIQATKDAEKRYDQLKKKKN